MKNIPLRTAVLTASLFFVVQGTLQAQDAARGKEVYNGAGACASCHGALGKGDGAAAMALNPKPRDFSLGTFSYDTDGDGKKGTEADLVNIITKGASAFGGSPMMVARPDLTESDRRSLAMYVLSLKAK